MAMKQAEVLPILDNGIKGIKNDDNHDDEIQKEMMKDGLFGFFTNVNMLYYI